MSIGSKGRLRRPLSDESRAIARLLDAGSAGIDARELDDVTRSHVDRLFAENATIGPFCSWFPVKMRWTRRGMA